MARLSPHIRIYMKYIDTYEIFEAKQVTRNYMLNSLKKNFCAFMYKKKHGEKRYAFGTLMPKYLKRVWRPTGAKSTAPPNNIVYWDLARKNFRQFDPTRFVKMIDKNPDMIGFANDHKEIYNKMKVHFPRKKSTYSKYAGQQGNQSQDENENAQNTETVQNDENTANEVSEKMKIVPLTDEEFNNIDGSDIETFSKIEKPTYNDICVPGNIVVTKEDDLFNTYLCIGKPENGGKGYKFISDKLYCQIGNKKTCNIMVQANRETGHPISYLACNHYIKYFPNHETLFKYDITSVYRTCINPNNIKSTDELFNILNHYRKLIKFSNIS